MPNKLTLFIILCIGILIGFLSKTAFSGRQLKSSAKFNETRLSGYNKYINPLLDCDTFPENNEELKPFQYKVDNLVNQSINQNQASHISVYFRDLNNGPWFGIHEEEKFTPASLLKVPLMIAYLKAAEKNPDLLQKKITYKSSNDNIQYFKPSITAEEGKDYSVDELLTFMIVYSDNNAKDILYKDLDEQVINKIYTDIGIEIPNVSKPEDYMSVKTYASFFRILYNASYLNKDMSEKALDLLIRSDFKKGIAADITSNIPVANKFGERTYNGDQDLKQLHDCGIVYYPNHPYLICVMTRGRNYDTLVGIIKNISSLIYHEVDNQYRK